MSELMTWSEALAYLEAHRGQETGIRRYCWPVGRHLRVDSTGHAKLLLFQPGADSIGWSIGDEIKTPRIMGGAFTADFCGACVWEVYTPAPRTVKRLFVGGPMHGLIDNAVPEAFVWDTSTGDEYRPVTVRVYGTRRRTVMVFCSGGGTMDANHVLQAMLELLLRHIDVPSGD